jgi:simple sugar transport system permease protein
LRPVLREALATAIAVLAALLVGSALILAYGRSPAQVYGLMLGDSWGSTKGLGQVLFRAGPLMLTGLAVAVAFRAGLFNIGAEGQGVAGAFAAAVIGTKLGGIPLGLGGALCLLAAIAVGGASGAIPGLLKARFGAHEVITTMMMNFILIGLVKQLGYDHFYAYPQEHTFPVASGARLPGFGVAGFGVATLVALSAAGAVYWLMARTRTGFALAATGASPAAAEASGISLGRTQVMAMTISGALAGLVAGGLVLGHKGYFQPDLVTGYGYLGIAVALLGRSHPLGVVVAALFVGTLAQGGVAVADLVPKELVDVLQAMLILSVASVTALVRRLPVEAT